MLVRKGLDAENAQLMEGPKGNHPKLIHEVVGLDFIILQHFMKSIFSSDNSLAQLKWNSEENSSVLIMNMTWLREASTLYMRYDKI